MYAGSWPTLVCHGWINVGVGVINETYSNVALKLVGFLDDLLQCLNHFDGVPAGLVSSLFFGKGADECCFDAVVYDLHD